MEYYYLKCQCVNVNNPLLYRIHHTGGVVALGAHVLTVHVHYNKLIHHA